MDAAKGAGWLVWVVLTLIVAIVAVHFWTASVHGEAVSRLICWLISMGLFAGMLGAIGIAIRGRGSGILIDERNRMSLSRLQIALWTTLLLTAISTTAASRLTFSYSENPVPRATGPARDGYDASERAKAALTTAKDAMDKLAAVIHPTKPPAGGVPDAKAPDAKAVDAGAAALIAAIQSVTQETSATIRSATDARNRASQSSSASSEAVQDALDVRKPLDRVVGYARQASVLAAKPPSQITNARRDELVKAGADARSASLAAAAELGTLGGTGLLPAFLAALGFVIPVQLWALMGITVTSAVASPLILNQKKSNPSTDEEKAEFKARVELKDTTVNRNPPAEGQVTGRRSVEDARFSNFFEGENVGNDPYVDMSRVQNFYFTILAVLVYGATLAALFRTPGLIAGLPDITPGLLVLLGISHAGYLAAKAMPPAPLKGTALDPKAPVSSPTPSPPPTPPVPAPAAAIAVAGPVVAPVDGQLLVEAHRWEEVPSGRAVALYGRLAAQLASNPSSVSAAVGGQALPADSILRERSNRVLVVLPSNSEGQRLSVTVNGAPVFAVGIP